MSDCSLLLRLEPQLDLCEVGIEEAVFRSGDEINEKTILFVHPSLLLFAGRLAQIKGIKSVCVQPYVNEGSWSLWFSSGVLIYSHGA